MSRPMSRSSSARFPRSVPRSRSVPLLSVLFSLCLGLALSLGARPARAHETTAPVIQSKVDPVYPPEALAAGVEGTVVMQLYVDETGVVKHAHVVSTPGFGLDAAAVAAARQFVFKPATSDGVPVASQVIFEQRFAVSRTMRSAVTAQSPLPEPHDHDHHDGDDDGDHDHGAGASPGYETVVTARGPMTSASATEVRDRDFELRPRGSPNDILRAVPGLVTAQHQGGGKADQIFLRGFDADHGTDVAVFVDDVPVNMPTHAHGQGYADLHFVIPEVMQTVEVYKGAYYPQFGDFATAGAVNLVTRPGFERSFVSVGADWFRLQPSHFGRDANNWRFLGVFAPDATTYVAVEAARADGPFANPEGLHRYNLFAKTTRDLGPTWRVGAMLTAYAGQWIGSGQIPLRLVGTPELPTRWDSLDPSEGGSTQRNSATVFLEARPDPLSRFSLRAYAIQYRMSLFNDFTFFLSDPVNGDELEQNDTRVVSGLNARYEVDRRLGRVSLKTIAGAQLRRDDGHVDIWDVTSQNGNWRRRLRRHADASAFNFGNDDDFHLQNVALYAAEDVLWTRWLRTVVALRGDYFGYDVSDGNPLPPVDPALPPDAGAVNRSGVRQVALLSPKASVVLTPRRLFDLYLNFGTGFHTNDARLAVTNAVGNVAPRATEGELGARLRLERLDAAVALWAIHLQSEIVFEGDAGTFSPSDASRRYGADFELRFRLLPWLWADADVALAHAEFVASGAGGGGAVPLAPRLAFTGGLTARHPRGWKAALRVRGVGDRPIIDPGDAAAFAAAGVKAPVAEGYTIVDLFAGWEARRWEVLASLQNALDSDWREAQFANASCSRAERARAGCPTLPDVHFTPGNPLTLSLTLKAYFF